VSLLAHRYSYAAHEALHEAGKTIDRIAETLRLETLRTLTTQHLSHSAQIYTEALSTESPL
jgi:hypothetical protein